MNDPYSARNLDRLRRALQRAADISMASHLGSHVTQAAMKNTHRAYLRILLHAEQLGWIAPGEAHAAIERGGLNQS